MRAAQAISLQLAYNTYPAHLSHMRLSLSWCVRPLRCCVGCSGKSSAGKLLARMLEYPFLDSDTLIEQLSKKSVADVFAQEGEDYFRELETSVLQEGVVGWVIKEGVVVWGWEWGDRSSGLRPAC